VIDRIEVRTSLRGRRNPWQTIRRRIDPDGTVIALNPDETFDRIEIRIPTSGVSGQYEGERAPGLAEIEVIAHAAGLVRDPSWSRGDTNCDGDHNLTDSVVLLNRLFTGAGELCCEVAADADGDQVVQVTDAIFLLDFLFRGGATPSAPYPDCAPAATGELSCPSSACP
jgi:hypothetical protein